MMKKDAAMKKDGGMATKQGGGAVSPNGRSVCLRPAAEPPSPQEGPFRALPTTR